jgi:hypothetical protein
LSGKLSSSIGRYNMPTKLGEGRMRVIYKAKETEPERPVAVNPLVPRLLRNEETGLL